MGASTSHDKKNAENARPKKKQLLEVDEQTMQKSQPSQKQEKQTKKWMAIANLEADSGQAIYPEVPFLEKQSQKVVLKEEQLVTILEEQ
ncbi:hypothetical protein ACH5RR_039357 [Cinchona calisaya]|uniref:Uncharacterized protein n=1 Tax=Cinchona calisaya TaxID=153742 RepID=A0ABD2XY25_9GENT